MYGMFLEGYNTLKSDHITFTCKIKKKKKKKKPFHCSFAKYNFFELPEKPPHARIKSVLRYMRVFEKCTRFH